MTAPGLLSTRDTGERMVQRHTQGGAHKHKVLHPPPNAALLRYSGTNMFSFHNINRSIISYRLLFWVKKIIHTAVSVDIYTRYILGM